MRVACVQFAPIHKDVEGNVREITRLLTNAEHADLFVLPELSLSGYAFSSSDEARPYATNDTHPAIEALRLLAKEKSAALVIGRIEPDKDKLYNAALLIDRKGEVILRYRKVHLFYYEKVVFARGNLGFPVASLDLGNGESTRIGIQICYDWRFPEATRCLALNGAELIVVPSNIVTTTGMLLTTLQTRAFENKVALAFADRTGTEVLSAKEKETLVFRGESAIINYNGQLLQTATNIDNTIIYSILKTSETSQKSINPYNDIFDDRVPEAYAELTKK